MLDARNVLTIGIDYRVVRGGVAAVENVYSTFYKPFNHVATTIDGGEPKWKKLLVLVKAYFKFWGWMLFHPEIRIVHVQGASGVSFWRKRVFIRMAKRCGRKVVWHMHGGMFDDFSKAHRKAVEETLGCCDAVIALSEYWKNFFETEFDYHRVIVVKNVIAAPQVDKQPHGCFTLLFLGLLGHNKGIYDLIDVIAQHKEEFHGRLKLRVGGNGEVDKVKNLIKEKEISDIVSYEGWVSGARKVELLNASDAYILPSYKEGLPISILEAMSYGLPTISTRVGGIPEIITDGVNGYLIIPGDKDAIYASIKKLLDNPELAKQMGAKSLERVKEHLPAYVEKQLHDLYESLV